jgi:hypothetical protein
MKVPPEELELAHADLEERGFCMLSKGKRVPPENWEETFRALPGMASVAHLDDEQLDDVPF